MRLVVLADDLTGAADSALPFLGAARVVAVSTSPGRLGRLLGGTGVVGLDLGTRGAPPALAYLATFSAVRRARRLDAGVFKKVDSQLRGSPAAELSGALDAWPGAVAVAAPALPALGRTVRGGELHGLPGGRRPSLVARLVGDPARPWRLVGLEELRAGGAAAALESLPEGGVALVDAEDEADLAAAVAATRTVGRPAVLVGSSGLAAAVACASSAGTAPATPAGRLGHSPPVAAAGPPRGVLVCSGTREPVARRQLAAVAAAEAALVEELDGNDPGAVAAWLASGLELAAAHLAAGGVCVLAAAGDPDRPEQAHHSRVLAAAADALLAAVPGCDLVATGGETARAVVDLLGEQDCEVVAAVETGVPLLRTAELGIGLVTKAGSFGGEGSLRAAVVALRAWRSGDAADGPTSEGGEGWR